MTYGWHIHNRLNELGIFYPDPNVCAVLGIEDPAYQTTQAVMRDNVQLARTMLDHWFYDGIYNYYAAILCHANEMFSILSMPNSRSIAWRLVTIWM